MVEVRSEGGKVWNYGDGGEGLSIHSGNLLPFLNSRTRKFTACPKSRKELNFSDDIHKLEL
jgi:hypothetical protein